MIKSTFHADLLRFRDLTEKKLDMVMTGVAGEGLHDLRYEAEGHIYTGWYRASWVVSKNTAKIMVANWRSRGWASGASYKNRPPYHVYKNKKTGTVRVVRAETRFLVGDEPPQPGIGTITRHDKIIFSNSVPYAERIATQFGLFRAAMADLRKMVDTIGKQVRNGATFTRLRGM